VTWEKRTGSWGHAIAQLATRQHGVVSRRQLAALGLSEREVDLRMMSGDLHPVFRSMSSHRGWSGRKIRDIRWHRVLFPTPEEIEIRDGIRCTTPARTLVDMAGRVGQQSLRRLIEQAAVLQALDVREVDRILARGRRRGSPNLRALLDVGARRTNGSPACAASWRRASCLRW
jgi:hypothetical protein